MYDDIYLIQQQHQLHQNIKHQVETYDIAFGIYIIEWYLMLLNILWMHERFVFLFIFWVLQICYGIEQQNKKEAKKE